MYLTTLLTADQIVYNLKSKNKNEIINELIRALTKNEKVKDRQLALKNVLERESHLSTGMENGLAVPHSKTTAVDELVIAFGLHKSGVNFDSLDGKPAHFIFLVLSPIDTSGPHIQALAQISRKIKSPEIREQLLKANSADDIEKILSQAL